MFSFSHHISLLYTDLCDLVKVSAMNIPILLYFLETETIFVT